MKSHLRVTIETRLKSGTSQHEAGVDRKTIRSYAAVLANPRGGHRLRRRPSANSPTPQRPMVLGRDAVLHKRAKAATERLTVGCRCAALEIYVTVNLAERPS